jgi:hypothetical protein
MAITRGSIVTVKGDPERRGKVLEITSAGVCTIFFGKNFYRIAPLKNLTEYPCVSTKRPVIFPVRKLYVKKDPPDKK